MKKDALGAIFRAEKRLGRGDLFELISHFPDGSQTSTIYQHEHHDGMGALMRESENWSGSSIDVPTFNLKSTRTWHELSAGLSGFAQDLSPSITQWRNLNRDAAYDPRYFAWRVYSPEQTQRLLSAARARRISLNSLLLWAANAVVAKELLAPSQRDCRWLVPVNMRRSEDERRSQSNHTSSVGLRFDVSASPVEIDGLYRQALNKWRALLAHSLAHGVASLGEDILYLLARRRGERNSWIGSFTNLGVWNFPDLKDGSHWPVAISVAPPAGTPCFPVGFGLITWQGHLSISLRLHAGLVDGMNDLQESILDQLTETLADMINSSLSPARTSRQDPRTPV